MIKKTFFCLSLAVGTVAFLGCSDKGGDSAGDTGGGGSNVPTETTIDSVGWDCAADAYWFDVLTSGWSTGGWLYIYQTGSSTPWNEDHPMGVYESDAEGYWSRLYLELLSVYPDYTAVVSGSTTLYSCDGKGMQNTLTFVVEADDMNGAVAVDCVVWGHNPDGAPADDCARVSASTASRLR